MTQYLNGDIVVFVVVDVAMLHNIHKIWGGGVLILCMAVVV